MKTKFKYYIIVLLATLMSSFNISFAQTNASPTYWGALQPDELQSKNGVLAILQGNSNSIAGAQTMTAVGVNNNTPNYMMDILATYVGDGVNISAPSFSGSPTNAVGYSIGDIPVLWNYGEPQSIYVGEYAGNGSLTNTAVANTFWGYFTGNNTTIGSYNSFGGYFSGINNLSGDSNVFIGNQCGYNNTSGGVNVYIGNLAGYNSNADSNVFIGDQSGYWNSTGYENIFSPDKI